MIYLKIYCFYSKMNNHEYKKNTTGPKSISKQEVTRVLNKTLKL